VSQCAYQSTMFREEARYVLARGDVSHACSAMVFMSSALIKDRMRATDKDAVIFCGKHTSTSARLVSPRVFDLFWVEQALALPLDLTNWCTS
jgi:hypothetical protein